MRSKFLFLAVIWFLVWAYAAAAQENRSKLRALAAGKKAMEFYRAGKYDDSAKIFKEILDKNPDSLIPKEMLALIGYQTKNNDMAQWYARLALKQNNRSVRAHFVMAVVLRDQANRLAALDHYRKAQKYANTQAEKDFIRENVLKLERPQPGEKIETASDITTPPASAEKPFIAVFAFEESGADSSGSLGQTVAEMLITALLQTDRFVIFERSQLNKILEEQALGQSGALDTDTAVDVGQLIGVDAILAGACSRVGSGVELDARLVQARSAEIKGAASGTARTEQTLRQAVEELAKKLAASADKIERRETEKEEEKENFKE